MLLPPLLPLLLPLLLLLLLTLSLPLLRWVAVHLLQSRLRRYKTLFPACVAGYDPISSESGEI